MNAPHAACDISKACEDGLVPFVFVGLVVWIFRSFPFHYVFIRVCFVRIVFLCVLWNGMFGSCELRILLLFNDSTVQ